MAEAVSKKSGPEDKSWSRILPKPPVVELKSREDELTMWRFQFNLGTVPLKPGQQLHRRHQGDERECERADSGGLAEQRSAARYTVPHQADKGAVGAKLRAYEQEQVAWSLNSMIREWNQIDMKKGNLLNQFLRLEEAHAETGAKLVR